MANEPSDHNQLHQSMVEEYNAARDAQLAAAIKLKETTPVPISETFEIRINDLQFAQGKVSFEKYFAAINKKITLSISNEYLREEYDAVKNYFEKIFGTKKITVTVSFDYLNGKDLYTITSSPQINSINQDTIEQVRFNYVQEAIRKRQRIDSDKTLYSMEELFDEISDCTLKAETFYKDEKELAKTWCV